MLPNERVPREKEDTILAEVRRLLDAGRVGPAVALLTPLARAETTTTRSLRSSAALFARARALGEAVAAFRALAQRYEHDGQLRLAAGALHQAYAFAKVVGPADVEEDVRADLAHILEQLGFRADAREIMGLAPTPSMVPPEPEQDVQIVTDDEIEEIVEVAPLESEAPAPRESGPRPTAAALEPSRSRARVIREPNREEIESTIAEIDFFLEIGDVAEAREIARTFLSRTPQEPTITAILDGLGLFETGRPPARLRQA